jgi:protein CMS1
LDLFVQKGTYYYYLYIYNTNLAKNIIFPTMGDNLEQNWAVDDIWKDDAEPIEPVKQETLSKKRPVPVDRASAPSLSKLASKPKKRKHSRGARGEQKIKDLSTPSKVLDYVFGCYTEIMEGKLSTLEMRDQQPSVNQFHSTNTNDSITHIVQTCFPNWESRLKTIFSKKSNSSPTVVVVAGSSNRACALIKELSKLKLPCAKLFSRHMKPDQQRDALKKTAYPLGVGTPNRILKLLDLGYMNLNKTTLIVFDVSTDVKGYSLFTQKETKFDAAVLMQRHLWNLDLQYACLTA